MKILPEIPTAALDLRMSASAGGASFEASLDLAATLRIRQAQSRAFAFAERGVLSPSDRQAAARGIDVAGAAWRRGAVMETATTKLRSDVDTAPAPGFNAIVPAGPGQPANASITTAANAPIVEAAPTAATTVGGAALVVTRSPTGPEPTQGPPPGRVAKVRQPAQDGRGATGAGDVSLAVHRTADGIIVVAASGELSPVALAQLRARAEAVARALGERLIEFRLNGALVAPQSLSGRT